jgi:hypothetical protein
MLVLVALVLLDWSVPVDSLANYLYCYGLCVFYAAPHATTANIGAMRWRTCDVLTNGRSRFIYTLLSWLDCTTANHHTRVKLLNKDGQQEEAWSAVNPPANEFLAVSLNSTAVRSSGNSPSG